MTGFFAGQLAQTDSLMAVLYPAEDNIQIMALVSRIGRFYPHLKKHSS